MDRRGVILPVVLFVLLLVGLLGAIFAFHVHADAASLQAVKERIQTRLAAEAGVDYVKLMMRGARFEMNRWYNNPDELHRIVFWADGTDSTVWGTKKELGPRDIVYRFSIVGDDPEDDKKYIRYGITDESSKLNLNLATTEQLLTLVTEVAADQKEFIPERIVDAIIDWRDADNKPSGDAGDTEGEYYRNLDRPYRVKNGPFDTVEELLLVKGVTAKLLFGEDFDRNGLITPNEDDGDFSFPPDNQDGVLNRGLFPYLTVVSHETNVSNDNQDRIYLMEDQATVSAKLAEVFPDEPSIVEFIVAATHAPPAGGPGTGGGGGAGGRGPGGQQSGTGSGQDAQGGAQDPRSGPGIPPFRGRRGTGSRGNRNPSPSPAPGSGSPQDVKPGEKSAPRERPRDSTPPPPKPADEREGEVPKNPSEGHDGEQAGEPADTEKEGAVTHGDAGAKPGGPGGAASGTGSPGSIQTPAALMRDQTIAGTLRQSPLTAAHLPVLMDRTTVRKEREIPGLINVNTAPPQVLALLNLTDEQIRMIVEVRAGLNDVEKMTTAWLITQEVLDPATYEAIAPRLTARGQQFTIEALGYADHIGMVSRLQVIVDMVGPIAQTIYYRDLTQLGGHYPIRKEDGEKPRVR